MGDAAVEEEEVDDRMYGLAASDVFQWGEIAPREKCLRNKYTVSAIVGKSTRGAEEGAGEHAGKERALVWMVDRRPRVGRHELQPPLVRVVTVNYEGIVAQQWQRGKFEIETRSQWVERQLEIAEIDDAEGHGKIRGGGGGGSASETVRVSKAAAPGFSLRGLGLK